MSRQIQILVGALMFAAAIGGFLVGAASEETFSPLGAIGGVVVTFSAIVGLGAYFHHRDKKQQTEQLPEDVKAVFARVLERSLSTSIEKKQQEQFVKPAKPEASEPVKQSHSDPNDYRVGDVIGGKFLVKKVLGGGMGRVYVAEFDDDVLVLKTILPERGDLKSFAEEARTWVGMGTHENIVSARWVDWVSGMLCVAADYVPPQEDGKSTIRDYIGSGKASINQILRWCAEFCFAMEHALARGLIAHRDIKPENLLIGTDGKLLVTDFGISKAATLEWLRVDDDANAMGAPTSGTPAYMAPEQWRGEQQDFRTDIYLKRAFPEKTPELERYNAITLYCLASTLLEGYVHQGTEPQLAQWFIAFETESLIRN